MRFTFLEHTADIKFQAYGESIEEAFANAAVATTEIMVETEKVKPIIKKTIQATGEDKKSLLVNFLEEFVFLLDTESFLLHDVISLTITDNTLTAEVVGDHAKNYETRSEVKAITYNDMLIEEKDKVTIQVVVDV